ncbi:hypothetical protein [Tunturiibacter gelidoferens]|uniref:Flagellar hook-length control protein FliK n=1 Tax=Tunturiibacter lichenicola TaxID=2051959 RepID=A0A7Y9NMN8_9BACT|nr:hypothetical protein [Edaphobacter lichenicola]NYF52209.1 hypothetical protein [Edaphobacter lichenicola]
MMSTAILMAMGAEQSSKQTVAHDIEQLEGPTFAQTLDARVEIAPGILAKDSMVATPTDTSNGKMESTAKNLIDMPDLANVAKARAGGGQEIRALVENKDIHEGKTVPLHTATAAGTQVQTKTKDTETQVAELPVNTEENEAETPAAPYVASTDPLQADEAIPLEHQAGKSQIQMSNVQAPVAQRETLVSGKTQEVAPVKKTATKTQEGEPSQTAAAAKSGAATVPPIANDTKSTHVVVVPSSNPTAGHNTAVPVVMGVPVAPVATSNITLKPEGDKSGLGSGSAPMTSRSFGVTPLSAPTNESASENSVHDTKTSVSDRETTVAAPGDSIAPAKPDAKGERLQVVAASAGGDSDTKTRLTGEPSVATVHAPAPGADATAGAATSFVTGLAKLPGGGGSTSTTSLSNGLREQDGLGSVARSTEPMPRTLSATPTALEVGIPDGTHGWLKVRAEITDGGVVNASVSAPSAASQEMLHRELPSLTAYLQSEKVAVNTVVVHPTASAGAESRGTPVGPASGGSGQTPRQSNEGAQQQGSVKAAAGGAKDVTSYQGLHGVDEDGTLPLATYGSGGSWLSVRA